MKFGIAFALLCSLASTSLADTAKAKAANSRGLALHKKKQFKEAAAEYQKAIAEDPNYVLAHYNLACALSLADDIENSLVELRWLADRASWDPTAKSAMKKASKDKDLKNVVAAGEDDPMYLEPLDASSWTTRDLAMPNDVFKIAEPAKDASLAKTLGTAPGPHEEKCSADAVAVPIDWASTVKGTVVATLRDGVGIVDTSGKVVLRSAPLGCGEGRASLLYAGFGSAVTLAGAADPGMVFVAKWAMPMANVAVYVKKDQQLVPVFQGPTAKLALTPQGNLLYTPLGDKKQHLLHWDAKAFKYVE